MINYIQKLYWIIWYLAEKNHFKRKYEKLPPKIYYDRKYRCYVNPVLLHNRGSLEDICYDTVRSGCLYLYCLDGEKRHAHTIPEVFKTAYNDAELFSIDAVDKQLYSEQELELIHKLVEQGKIDCQTK